MSGYGDHEFAQLTASVRTIVLSLSLISFSKRSHFSVRDRFKVAVVSRIEFMNVASNAVKVIRRAKT